MKKPNNPSKVIIIPQTPQNNRQDEVVQGGSPVEEGPQGAQTASQAPAQQTQEPSQTTKIDKK